MGKVFKAIVIGAIIAVIAVYAYPLLGFSSTPFAGLFHIKNALLAAAIGGGITGGLSALLAPSLDLSTVQMRIRVSVDAQAEMKWVFGTTALSTDLVWAGRHGAGNDFYSYIIAGAGHLIESYQDLYINDEIITFSGDAATGAWADGLWRQTRLGTESQTAFIDIDGDDNFANTLWPATADGLGMAHYRLRFKIDHEKVEGGIPTRITQVAQGGPVYDPRLDSTRGGTGAHRTDDQSTWQWENGGTILGDNWALVVLRYLLGWKINGKLVIGVGIDGDDIDMDQAMAAANVSEATVDGIPRYRVGGLLPVTNDHEAIIKQLEGAINGKVATVGGMYYIWAPNDDLTTFSDILEGDLLRAVGVDFTPSGDLRLLYNTARGRYVDPGPESLYQPRPYPEVEESAAVTEDGGVRFKEHDFSLIQDESIAERVAREIVRRSRFGATWRFAVGPKGLTFQPFDVTILNCQETNNVNVTVRIINMSFSVSGAVVMEVIEEDSSIYNTTAPLGTSVAVNDPGGFDPTAQIAVTGLAAAVTTVTGSAGTSSDGLRVTWDDPGAFVVETQVQFKKTTGTDYIAVPATRVDLQTAIIVPLDPGTAYDIRARHITRAGVVGVFASTTQTTGTDGTDIISPPDYAVSLTYDDLDTTQLAAGQSRYAMLTARATDTSGSQNNFQNTDAILINKADFDGAIQSGFYGTLRVGERIAFVVSNIRWYLFSIDEIMGVVGTGAAQAYKVGVVHIFQQDTDPTVNIPTAAGTAVTFEFQRTQFSDIQEVADPDFDLSTGTVGAFVSGTYWQIGIIAGDARVDWRPGDGEEGSNAIDFFTFSGGGAGDRASLISEPKIKAQAQTWEFIIKYQTTAATASVPLQFITGALGWKNPLDKEPTQPIQSGQVTTTLDESLNVWKLIRIVVPTSGFQQARYWNFSIGYNQGFHDFERTRIDSVFIRAISEEFGTLVGNTYQAGNVPKSTTPADDNLVLQADGTWVANTGGGATELSDLTDVNTSTPTNRHVLVADGVDFESRRLVAADIDFTATNRFLGRDTAGAGDGEEITAGAARTILNVEDNAAADQTAGEIEAIVSHDNLLGFLATEHVDWAVTGAENIHADRLDNVVVDRLIVGGNDKLVAISTSQLEARGNIVGSNPPVDTDSGVNNFVFTNSNDTVAWWTLDAGSGTFGGLTSNVRGQNIRWRATKVAGGLATVFSADPDAGALLAYNGGERLITLDAGIRVSRAATGASVYIEESAAAAVDVTGDGQYWVALDGTPMFTNDLGTDFDLTSGGASAFNDLTDVNLTGAVNNDLLYRSAGDWIDTAGALTWNGSTLKLVDDARIQLGSTQSIQILWSSAGGFGSINTGSGQTMKIQVAGGDILNFTDNLVELDTLADMLIVDNSELRFGTGNDARIYFNTIDLYIDMVDGVDFRLRGGAALDNMIVALQDGSVTLSYNGTDDLRTQNNAATGQTSGAEVKDHGNNWRDVGFNFLPVFNDNVSDTLEAEHCGQMAFKDASTARTLTLAASGNLDFPIHAMTTVVNAFTSGNYIVTEGASTTLYYLDGATRIDTAGGLTIGPGGVANIWRESATVYYAWGTGIVP